MIATIPEKLWNSYPDDVRPRSPILPLGNSGGLSGSSLFRFASPRGDLLARCWPEGTPADRVATIHDRIARAEALPFVPRPIADRHGRTFQILGGSTWELGPWMPGSADPGPPPVSRLRSAMTGLASFHLVAGGTPTKGVPPGLSARLSEAESLLRGGFDRLRDHVAPSPRAPDRDLALRWIEGASEMAAQIAHELRVACSAPAPVLWVLRDARPEHFLFSGEHLTGLIDFGAMGRDAVAADLSRCLFDWADIGEPLRSEAIRAYDRIRPLEPIESALIGPYARSSALLGGARWVRWHFVEGRRFEDAGAVSAGLKRTLDRFDRVFRGSP